MVLLPSSSYKNVPIPIKKCVLVSGKNIRTMKNTGGVTLPESKKEDATMALSDLASWTDDNTASACGAACGASDKPAEKPAACGSACGAGDKPAEAPAACGAADKPAEKPAPCGAADKQ